MPEISSSPVSCLPGVCWDYKAGHLQRLWPHTQTPDPASPEYQQCSHFHPLGESLLPPEEFHFSPFTKTNKQLKSNYFQEQFITFLEVKHFLKYFFYNSKKSGDGKLEIGCTSSAQLMYEWTGENTLHLFIENPERGDGGEHSITLE